MSLSIPEIVAQDSNSEQTLTLPSYHEIIVGADASDHSDRGILESVAIGKLWQASITGAHVYAAKLHDRRFRQMEGGLPENFREENELERQRDIHDELITKGLSIITDSYLDEAEQTCKNAGLNYIRSSLEGKNYTEMVRAANSQRYDLLVLGAQGLGAIASNRIGTVCERVVRRTAIDTLIIKQAERSITDGPIVCAVDGSEKAFGGLLTALSLAKEWQVPLHVISAYDPYYHYVAFNRIAKVLSDEAGKVFRFKEQEQLHEDIIDAGLAKIYQSHLEVSESIAAELGIEITTKLLAGKPYDVIDKYVKECNASLLVIGKLGVHADDDLDIGGNAENLLRHIDCALLLSQREHKPQVEVLAEATTSWTHQAEARMKNIPSFAQGMARTAILRYAQEKGHTVITESIVREATDCLCPAGVKSSGGKHPEHIEPTVKETITAMNPDWSDEAKNILAQVADNSLRGNIRHRAEKSARQNKHPQVLNSDVEKFINKKDKQTVDLASELVWETAATTRISRIPEGFMRDSCRKNIEQTANEQNLSEITLVLVEQEIGNANQVMKSSMQSGESACPFKAGKEQTKQQEPVEQPHKKPQLNWSEPAQVMLQRVPAGTIRTMAKKATETIGLQANLTEIDEVFFQQILATFQAGSEQTDCELEWTEAAKQGIEKAPKVVQGMLIKEIENMAKNQEVTLVDEDIVQQAKAQWDKSGYFHLDPADTRSAGE